jgi:histidinol-phosphate aminotransferase
MTQLVTPAIASIRPYVPGKPVEELERELGIQGADKLASNENPLGPSPRAIEAIRRAAAWVHYYPEGDGPFLKARLAEHLGVTPEEIVLGNGSNEILELLVRTYATPAHHAVISDHAFLVYRLVLTAASVPFTSTPMRAMKHDLEAMRAAIRPSTRLVFIANPNNPTGTYNTRVELEAFLEGLRDDVIVVLDEAYFEYVEASDFPDGLTLRARHPNVIATRTFSKCYGLAGLRIGYGVSSPELIGYLNRVRQPFNTSRIAQEAALAALGDRDFVAASVAMNREQRAHLIAALTERRLECVPSECNFVLVKVPRRGAEVVRALLHHGVIVREMDGYGFPEHVRVTVGRPEQNARFLAALDAVLGA